MGAAQNVTDEVRPESESEDQVDRAAEGAPRRGLGTVTIALLAALVVVLAGGDAYLFASRRSPIYGARAEVLYDVGTASSSGPVESEAQTRLVVARSRAVLAPVAEGFGMPVQELSEALTAETVDQSNVVRFTLAHPNPERARRIVHGVAERYVASIEPRSTYASEEVLDLLNAQVADLRRAQSATERELADIESARQVALLTGEVPPDPAEESRLRMRLGSLFQRADDLNEQITELQIQQLNQAQARILTPAYVLEEPLAPNPMRAAVVGALLGLALAAALVLVLLRLRRTDAATD